MFVSSDFMCLLELPIQMIWRSVNVFCLKPFRKRSSQQVLCVAWTGFGAMFEVMKVLIVFKLEFNGILLFTWTTAVQKNGFVLLFFSGGGWDWEDKEQTETSYYSWYLTFSCAPFIILLSFLIERFDWWKKLQILWFCDWRTWLQKKKKLINITEKRVGSSFFVWIKTETFFCFSVSSRSGSPQNVLRKSITISPT